MAGKKECFNGSNGCSLSQRLFKTLITTKNEKIRLCDVRAFFTFSLNCLESFSIVFLFFE